MLTVKHVEITGHENIYPAARVSYQPRQRADGSAYDPHEPSAASDDIAPCVFIDTPKGDTLPLGSFGTVYVMNEQGRTIATYRLYPTPMAGVTAGMPARKAESYTSAASSAS